MSSQNLTITDSPRKRYRLFKKKPAGAGWGCQNDVRFTPNNGHSEGSRKESVNDPKRTWALVRFDWESNLWKVGPGNLQVGTQHGFCRKSTFNLSVGV